MPNLDLKGVNLTAELTVWPQALPPDYMALRHYDDSPEH